MVKPVDTIHGAMDQRRGRVHGGPKVANTRHGDASPMKAGEEEDDKVVPMRGSLGLRRQRRGVVTVVEDGGRKLHVAQVLERERERARE
jgi:hypothetical protein